MRTRTLLLLSVACGIAILAAGVALLWRLDDEDAATSPQSLGAPVAIGDLTITVEGYEERNREGIVTVELGGVDDPDGAAAFRLVVPGAALEPTEPASPAASLASCGSTTEAFTRCVLAFELDEVQGTSRVLLYRRGDEQVRWELGG